MTRDDNYLSATRQGAPAPSPSLQITIPPVPRAPVRAALAKALAQHAARRLPFGIAVPVTGTPGAAGPASPHCCCGGRKRFTGASA